MYRELIAELVGFVAPSGREGELQKALLGHVATSADETYIDVLGNGIARKHGQGPHVMLVAHADEPGVMVIDIDAAGYLRITPLGQLTAAYLVGRQVQFETGITGIIGVESGVKLSELTFDHLYVDIGAATDQEALAQVPFGAAAVVMDELASVGAHRLVGRALRNRVGCAIAIEAFKRASAAGCHVSVVFSAQQTVGARGAKTAAFQLNPDLALVIDAVPAGDTPKAKRMAIRLGGGPAVKVLDGSVIVPIAVKNHIVASAERSGVAVQFEVWPGAITDAGEIHVTHAGIPVGGISYPARYVDGSSTMIDLRDVAATADLVEACCNPAKDRT